MTRRSKKTETKPKKVETAEAVEELRVIIQTIRPAPLWETTTPRPEVTLEWP